MDVSADTGESTEYNLCHLHNLQLEYYCIKCKTALCKRCFLYLHRNHTVILAEDLLAEEFENDEKKKIFVDEGKDVLKFLTKEIEVCDHYLYCFKLFREQECKWLDVKKNLLTQKQSLQDTIKKFTVKEELEEAPGALWTFLRAKSFVQDDELRMTLREVNHKIVYIMRDANHVFWDCEDAAKLKLSEMMPQEFMPNNVQWKLTGDYKAQKALATLENSKNKPQGSVIVRSTTEKPVLCLSPLLIKLAEAGLDIELHLLDSFWSRYSLPSDCERLEPFLRAGHGDRLRVFYGHIEAESLQSMKDLERFGLRLEEAKDVETFNSVNCGSGIVSVSRQLQPVHITEQVKENTSLCCVELEDGEVPWLLAVATKLIDCQPPTEGYDLVLPACRLTRDGVAQLLEMPACSSLRPVYYSLGFRHVYLQSTTLSPSDREQLEEVASRNYKPLTWELNEHFLIE